jgi:hypothetical protein
MSFTDRLIHAIAIERPYQTLVDDVAAFDDYNQPIREYVSATEEVRGLIQPKSVREVPLVSEGGAQIGLHTAFFTIDTDLTNADRLHLIDTGEVYEVKGLRPFRFGRSPHYEVDCDLVTSADPTHEAAGS